MLSTIIITVHNESQKLYQKVKKRSEYSYRSAPLNEHEYENDILLEEDDDGTFDYEETNVPKLLTDDDLKKLKQTQKSNEKKAEGLLDMPSINKKEINDDVAIVVNEIEKNIYYDDNTTRDNSSK